MVDSNGYLWLYVAVRVQLTPSNALRLKQIANDSNGLFLVHGIVNIVLSGWLDDRSNVENEKCGWGMTMEKRDTSQDFSDKKTWDKFHFGTMNRKKVEILRSNKIGTASQARVEMRKTLAGLHKLEKETKTQLYARPQKPVSRK